MIKLHSPFTLTEIYISQKLKANNGGDWEILECSECLPNDINFKQPRTRESQLVFSSNASTETIGTKSHNYMIFSRKFNGGNSGWFVVGANPPTQHWMGPVYDSDIGDIE